MSAKKKPASAQKRNMMSFFSPKGGKAGKKAQPKTPESSGTKKQTSSPDYSIVTPPVTNGTKARVSEQEKVKRNLASAQSPRRSPRKRAGSPEAAVSPKKAKTASPSLKKAEAKAKTTPAKPKAKAKTAPKSKAKPAAKKPKAKAKTAAKKKANAKNSDDSSDSSSDSSSSSSDSESSEEKETSPPSPPSSPVVANRRLRKRKRVIRYDVEEDEEDEESGDEYKASDCEPEEEDDDGYNSDMAESDEEEEENKPLRRAKKAPAKRKKKICDDEDEDDNNADEGADMEDEGDGVEDKPRPMQTGDVEASFQSFKRGSQPDEERTMSKKNANRRNKIMNASVEEDSQVAAGTENSANLDLSKINFCYPDKIRDIKRRRPTDPEYDPKTLYIPESKWKEFSPGQKQYWEIKQYNWDVVLFFKVGKFYELFDFDAHVGVKELGLTYMKAARPHSGFPESAVDKYAAQLVKLNYKVGRVEQVETPAMLAERNKTLKKKEKAVRREMCSVLTPGTLVDTEMIGSADAKFVLVLFENDATDEFGVCILDTGAGSFRLGEFKDDRQRTNLRTLLTQIRPQEIVQPKDGLTSKTNEVLRCELPVNVMKSTIDKSDFWNSETLVRNFAKAKYFEDQGLGEMDKEAGLPASLVKMLKEKKEWALTALGGCVSFLKRLLLDNELISMGKFGTYDINEQVCSSNTLILDGQTLQNLEILENTEGGKDGTLLKQVDHTKTPFGKRLLREWVSQPLCQIAAINERLDNVEYLMNNHELRDQLTSALSKLPDMERMLSRIHAFGLAQQSKAIMYENVSAKKVKVFLQILAGFKRCMKVPGIFKESKESGDGEVPSRIAALTQIGQRFPDLESPLKHFDEAFDHIAAKTTGFIVPAKGNNEPYDDAAEEEDRILQELNDHLMEQKEYFGDRSIRFVNRGKEIYQIEIPLTSLNKRKIPSGWNMLGSTKKNKRYITPFIKEILPDLEEAKMEKESLLKDATRQMFCDFCDHYTTWSDAVACIGELDCLLSLAITSKYQEGASCRPKLIEPTEAKGSFLDIRGGIHPALATMTSGSFIPNDTIIGAGDNPAKFVLVSGPNMGGKSTLLRQTCSIVIMAQLGCFVPAEKCTFTPIDRIFTRVGASDRIMQGQSTFLVELEETANILRHATNRSLIILDELGRGTSTFDGTAIAYSVIRFLCEKKQCMSLFSTHYHMLMEDFAKDERIAMYHMACNVDPNQKDVTFLYKFIKGTCPKSYGMNVATLAGLPQALVGRAQQMSQNFEVLLEKAHNSGKSRKLANVIAAIGEEGKEDLDQLRKLVKV